MIVKVISHNNMKSSAAYLYRKAEKDPKTTGQHPAYSMQRTNKEFLLAIENLRDMRYDEIRRKSGVNNQIKHLVLSVHPCDADRFNDCRDEILEKLFDELGIEPENHVTNAFIHNDSAHPHVHVLFSRIGEDLSIVKTQDIGKKLGDFAERMSKDFGLRNRTRDTLISFGRNDLYNPTDRTVLYKLVEFAIKEASTVQEYEQILRKHGVRMVNTDNRRAYLILNPKCVDDDEFQKALSDARKYRSDVKKYKKFLLSKGIIVKFDDVKGEIYSLKKYTIIYADRLHKNLIGERLRVSIENSNHDIEYLKLRRKISNEISNCSTLGDIKRRFPEAKLYYKIIENRVENISLVFDDHYIRLHEAFAKDVRIDKSREYPSPLHIPVFFTPQEYDIFEEEKQKGLAKKYGKKTKAIGFKFQI